MQIKSIIAGAIATGMTLVGTVMALPRDTVPNSVRDTVTSVYLPGDLTTTPSIAAFLNDNWVGIGSYALSHQAAPEWMAGAVQFVAANATVATGHVAHVVAMLG